MGTPIVTGTCTDNTVSVHIDLFRYPVRYIKVYSGGELIGTFHPLSDFHLRNEKRRPVKIVLVFADGDRHETTIIGGKKRRNEPQQEFKPGDILVACDNFGDFPPPGYMGHSAMVLDDQHIIEAVTSMPQIRKSPIKEFIEIHPKYLHLRCKDRYVAINATDFAKSFLQIYDENIENGSKFPTFSFSTNVSLDDPWNAIYCSKLVWLCYYYGAQLELANDYFLYSPEDLSTLENDDRFEVIYKHPEFQFFIDT